MPSPITTTSSGLPAEKLLGANMHLELGQVAEARALADDVAKATCGQDAASEAQALLIRAHCDRIGEPQLREAGRASRRAAQLFEQLGDPEGEARALITLAHVTMVLGRNDEAVEAALMAVRLSDGKPSPLAILAHNILGLAYSWVGDQDRADASLNEAARISSQCRPSRSAYQPRLNQMWVELARLSMRRCESGSLGDLSRLVELGTECRHLRELGYPLPMPGLRNLGDALFHASVAVLAAWKNDSSLARSCLEAARRALPPHDSWVTAFVIWGEAELAWSAGDLDRAVAKFREMEAMASSVEHEQLAVRAQLMLTQLLQSQGRASESLAVFQHLRRRERRLIDEAMRSREALVSWQLDARQREHRLAKLLRQSEEDRAANLAKTRFLATASHDLRQPIHSTNMLLAALALRDLDDRTRNLVALLESVNQTLGRQLDGLLDISKLDAGVVSFALKPERLDRMAASVYTLFEPLARQRGVKIELNAASDLCTTTDPGQFERLLGNLVDNAVKFTQPGGEVVISAIASERGPMVTVADTGVGMSEEELLRVFEEFYQSRPDRERGLGLGLSIVKRLATSLGIDLHLTSNPGLGTTVELILPEGPSTEDAVPMNRTASLAGKAVLVVDDDHLVLNSTRVLFEELGCTVYLAEEVAGAARLAREVTLDAVVSDCRLGHQEDGFAVLKAVRQRQPAAVALLISGDTSPQLALEARTAGVPLVFKPVTASALVSALALPHNF